MRRPAQGRGTAQRTRRPRKAVLSGAVLLCGAPPGAAARPRMCSALCGKGRGRFWLMANGRFLRHWPCQSRGGAFALVHGPVFCYNKISTGPRAAQARAKEKERGVFIWAALLRGTAWPSILRARWRCSRPSPFTRRRTRGPLINWATPRPNCMAGFR